MIYHKGEKAKWYHKGVKLPSFSSKDKKQKDDKLSVMEVKKTTGKLMTYSTKDWYNKITRGRVKRIGEIW